MWRRKKTLLNIPTGAKALVRSVCFTGAVSKDTGPSGAGKGEPIKDPYLNSAFAL